jgi:hypothetical protein
MTAGISAGGAVGVGLRGFALRAAVHAAIVGARPVLTIIGPIGTIRRPLVVALVRLLRAARAYSAGVGLSRWIVARSGRLSGTELSAIARLFAESGAWIDAAGVWNTLIERKEVFEEPEALDAAAILLGLGEVQAARRVLSRASGPIDLHDPSSVRLLIRRAELQQQADPEAQSQEPPLVRLYPPGADPDRTAPWREPGFVGRFGIEPHHLGLRISGWVTSHGGADRVEILANDQLLASVRADRRSGAAARRFRIIFRWQSLTTLPARTVFTVRAGARPLVQPTGGQEWVVEVFGAERAEHRLAGRLTKKGTRREALSDLQDEGIVWDAVRTVVEALSRAGRTGFVLYGTLLGAVREGRIVAGDDDVDLAFVANATTEADLREELLDLSCALLAQGLTIAVKEAHGWAALEVHVGPVAIDLTAILIVGDRAWAYRRVCADSDAYSPPVQLDVDGGPVPVPADPERVLASIYGSSWRTPDPDFQHYPTRREVRQLRNRAFTGDQVIRLFAAADASTGALRLPRHAGPVLDALRRAAGPPDGPEQRTTTVERYG